MSLSISAVAQRKQMTTLSWQAGGQLPRPLAGTITGISNNHLIVAGGNNFPDSMPWLNGKKKYYSDVYVFSKMNNEAVLNKKQWQLHAALAYAAVCTTGQGVFYAGGENENGISDKAGLLIWDSAQETILIRDLPDLPKPLSNAAAAADGNNVYIAGGETNGAVTDGFYCIDLENTNKGWQQLMPLPNPLSHTLAVVQSNGLHDCLYLLGGRKKNNHGISELYATVLAFDFITSQWQHNKPLPYQLSAGAGIAMEGNSILLFGGDKGETFHKTEVLIAAIAAETNPENKAQLQKDKIVLQSTHPGFSRQVLQYNTIRNNYDLAGFMPANNPVTTTAAWWGNEIVITGGEIKAGVRTANIMLGSYKK